MSFFSTSQGFQLMQSLTWRYQADYTEFGKELICQNYITVIKKSEKWNKSVSLLKW